MNDYISKPITFDALRKAIDRWGSRGAASFGAGEVGGTDETLDEAPDSSVSHTCCERKEHPPSTSSEGVAASPIDIEYALMQLGGDRELLHEVLDLFVEQIPQLVAECRAACAEGDMVRLGRAAHTIKGTTGNVRANEAYAAAMELERAAEGCEVDAARAMLDALEQHLRRLREFTVSFFSTKGAT